MHNGVPASELTGVTWRKSSFSAAGNCVEFAKLGHDGDGRRPQLALPRGSRPRLHPTRDRRPDPGDEERRVRRPPRLRTPREPARWAGDAPSRPAARPKSTLIHFSLRPAAAAGRLDAMKRTSATPRTASLSEGDASFLNLDAGSAADVVLDPSDTRVPRAARIHDALSAARTTTRWTGPSPPRCPTWTRAAPMVRAERGFLRRIVPFLVRDAGLRQLLDIGTGIPASPNVHELAQAIAAGDAGRLRGRRSRRPRARPRSAAQRPDGGRRGRPPGLRRPAGPARRRPRARPRPPGRRASPRRAPARAGRRRPLVGRAAHRRRAARRQLRDRRRPRVRPRRRARRGRRRGRARSASRSRPARATRSPPSCRGSTSSGRASSRCSTGGSLRRTTRSTGSSIGSASWTSRSGPASAGRADRCALTPPSRVEVVPRGWPAPPCASGGCAGVPVERPLRRLGVRPAPGALEADRRRGAGRERRVPVQVRRRHEPAHLPPRRAPPAGQLLDRWRAAARGSSPAAAPNRCW